jgi:ferrous iron transport protein A
MSRFVNLDSLGDRESMSIVALEGETLLTSRLRELGFIGGEVVTVRGRAPFGDPLLIELRGFCVALRKGEAKCVRGHRCDSAELRP